MRIWQTNQQLSNNLKEIENGSNLLVAGWQLPSPGLINSYLAECLSRLSSRAKLSPHFPSNIVNGGFPQKLHKQILILIFFMFILGLVRHVNLDILYIITWMLHQKPK